MLYSKFTDSIEDKNTPVALPTLMMRVIQMKLGPHACPFHMTQQQFASLMHEN